MGFLKKFGELNDFISAEIGKNREEIRFYFLKSHFKLPYFADLKKKKPLFLPTFTLLYIYVQYLPAKSSSM